jgi:hypothetical protein
MISARSHARVIPARVHLSPNSLRFARIVLWIAIVAAAQMALPVASAHAATVTVNSTSSAVDFAGPMGIGDLPGPDGLVTFAEAAIATTNTPGPDLIAFNIPLSDPGLLAGSFMITSEGFITLGDDYTTVDGTTQTAFTGDTSSGPEIWLFGSIPMSMSAPGLRIMSSHNRVTGVGGFNWFKEGIQIQGNDNVVAGCTAVQVLNSGVLITGANNLIGGSTPADRNLFSLCGTGITVSSAAATGNIIRGNFIGTDITGTSELGNNSSGITAASWTTIGGAAPGEGNVIAANGHLGEHEAPIGTQIWLVGDHNTVIGNLIGTDQTGTVALGGSVSAGVEISGSWNTVGAPGAGNLISGHSWRAFGGSQVGVRLSGGRDNVVQSNRIGTDISGTRPLPNARGVEVAMYSFLDLARDSRIGGPGPGEGNVIAHNLADGIGVNGSAGVGVTGVTVSRNSIFANGELGINLSTGFSGYPGTVTPNDLGDVDSGPNNLQNFPVLVSAADNGFATTVTGTIDMASPFSATVEIYSSDTLDPSGFGEGQSFAASAIPSAAGSFVATLPAGLAGKYVTAIATDASGNTSEFSAGIGVESQVTAVDPTAGGAGRRMDIYPNPARAEASVRLYLPGAELASLAVFDLKGRKVRTIAGRRLFESGLHELPWRGDDDRGAAVPPGVYFFRLDGAAGSEIRKVLLTR